MAKKVVKKIAEKKSDKPKAAKAPKPTKVSSNAEAKAEANPEAPKAAPVAQQTPVAAAPIVQPAPQAPAAKPDVDQWKKDHIAKNKITKAYFHVKGGIYRTSDGKLFANPEEFFAAGGALDQVHGL